MITLLTVLIFFFYYDFAYAYLDPGSGSYILHLIVAAFAGFIVTIKLYWLKLTNFFFKLTKKNKKKK